MAMRSDDEAQILALIHANRVALWTHDFEAYEKCFVHAPYTTRWNATRVGGLFVRQGWEDIAERVKRQFSGPPAEHAAVRAHETTVENLQLRVEGDMAWASFNQCYKTTPSGLFEAHLTHEIRILERHGGEWRIAFLGFLDDHADHADRALLRLDSTGKVTWRSASSAAALEADDDLFLRAGRLHIRDRRADQQLQAAIAWAAQLDSGLFSMYRGALPIVLAAGQDLPTKVWWVIAESDMILFSMGDRGLTEHRLDAAALVYGLSPAQRRLAGHIAQGLSLVGSAQAMKITPSTARTHLERIFDKTGVRHQPALVRVLLSAAAPL